MIYDENNDVFICLILNKWMMIINLYFIKKKLFIDKKNKILLHSFYKISVITLFLYIIFLIAKIKILIYTLIV